MRFIADDMDLSEIRSSYKNAGIEECMRLDLPISFWPNIIMLWVRGAG